MSETDWNVVHTHGMVYEYRATLEDMIDEMIDKTIERQLEYWRETNDLPSPPYLPRLTRLSTSTLPEGKSADLPHLQ